MSRYYFNPRSKLFELRPTNANFRVDKQATNQTGIVSGVETKVTWSGSTSGDDTYFDFTNNRFTPTNGESAEWGLYTTLLWTSTADDDELQVTMYLNGAIRARNRVQAKGTQNQNIELTNIVILDGIDDYVEVFTQQTSGSDKVINGSVVSSWFCGWRIN